MKVVQIIPLLGLAGAEVMCQTLSMELARQGIEVVVVSLYDYRSSLTERIEKSGIKLISLRKKSGLDLSIVGKLVRLFREEKPDVVQSHLYALKYAVAAAILAGVKGRVHTMHSVAQKEAKPSAQRLNRFFYRWCHVIPVALSEEVQRTVQSVYGLQGHQVPVIFNGIDLGRCIPKKSYADDGIVHFIHVGRFTEAKNHKMMFQAFDILHKTHSNTELWLFGAGELEADVRTKVHDMGLEGSVIFKGLSDNIYPELNQADVFLLPSSYEGMPMSLIEAMGTGLPCVATNVGGIPTMIENGVEGILTEVSAEAIAEGMAAMLDAEKRRTYGLHALTKSAVFSSKTMAEHYIQVYKGTQPRI